MRNVLDKLFLILMVVAVVLFIFAFTFDTSNPICASNNNMTGEEIVKSHCIKTIYAPPGVKVVDVRFRYSKASILPDYAIIGRTMKVTEIPEVHYIFNENSTNEYIRIIESR